jgi:hypothetical protein
MSYGRRTKPTYWWIRYNIGGKTGLLGWYATESEANDDAAITLRGMAFEIIPLHTKNKSAASSKLRAVILHETKDINQAMQRIRRKPPNETPNNTTVIRYL